jgi:hypothetical protein
VVLAATVLVMWRGKITVAIAAALLSGLLLSYHAFIADAVLLIPAGLLLMRDKSSLAHRVVGIVLLSPLAFIGFQRVHAPYPPAALVLLPLLVMAGASLRRRFDSLEPSVEVRTLPTESR